VKWTSSEAAGEPAGSGGAAAALERRWQRWLNRRIPPASSLVLDRRRIFIFPSGTGFFFMGCLLVMLIAAINYQNNSAYALTFLLANLFVIAVLHSYANLSGLRITAVGADDGFPGQRCAFHLRLACSNRRGHMALAVGWPEPFEERRRRRPLVGLFSRPRMVTQQQFDVFPGEERDVTLHVPVKQRGWFRPGRLRIDSYYPLGLLRCWTWIELDLRALVYPAPLAVAEPQASSAGDGEGEFVGGSGDDEFAGLRDYRRGDSPRRVYWKGLARGQEELQSKEFAAVLADERWLDWEHFAPLGTEQRLSALCHWVLELQRREREFGLRLPGMELAAGSGERHCRQALRALALYGQEEQP